MITIIEDTPKKLSGITSLFISFNFKQQIVDTIKSLDKYHYNNENYTWEVPINNLSYLLDELTYFDDITLTIKSNDDKKEQKTIILKDKYKTKPLEHQLEGILYGLNHDSWLLLDDPGLGKTLQMIYLAQELKEQSNLKHCLVICGINSLKTNWESEIEKHSDLSYRILGKKVSKKGKVSYKTRTGGDWLKKEFDTQEEVNSFRKRLSHVPVFKVDDMKGASRGSVVKADRTKGKDAATTAYDR